MLEPAFQCYSPGSRRWYEFAEAGELDQLAAEVKRIIAALAAAAPGRIAKGTLTEQEARRLADLWTAISEDLEAQFAPVPVDRLRELRAANGVPWAVKVDALRRELEARRLGYPAEVNKGRLTRDQAKQQLERVEAIHALYWRDGYAFDGTRDELRAISGPMMEAWIAQEGAARTTQGGVTINGY
jgi:hypothetical protein